MRKFVVFGALALLILSLPVLAEKKFKDMPDDHWAAEAVYSLVKMGVTSGFPDGTFKGKNTLNRYETAVFLDNLSKYLLKGVKDIVKEEVGKAGPRGGAAGAAVSGKAYFDYTHGIQNSTTKDFDITRTYLTFKNKIADNAKTNVTFDVARNSVSATSTDMPLTSYIKYAYVEISDLLPAGLQIIPTSLNLKLGMQPTYWIGYIDKILGIRYIAKNLTDNNSQLSSADLGVGGSGKVDLLGLTVEYDGALINGAGYKKAENNSAKTVNLRVNSEVFPGVEVALGGEADYASSGLTNRVLNALASYKGYGLISYAEYYYGKANSGLTIGATYDLAGLVLDGYKLIGRYDSYDAGRDGSATTTVIAGVEYKLAKNVLVALDYIGVTASGATTGTINLHSQYKF